MRISLEETENDLQRQRRKNHLKTKLEIPSCSATNQRKLEPQAFFPEDFERPWPLSTETLVCDFQNCTVRETISAVLSTMSVVFAIAALRMNAKCLQYFVHTLARSLPNTIDVKARFLLCRGRESQLGAIKKQQVHQEGSMDLHSVYLTCHLASPGSGCVIFLLWTSVYSSLKWGE